MVMNNTTTTLKYDIINIKTKNNIYSSKMSMIHPIKMKHKVKKSKNTFY